MSKVNLADAVKSVEQIAGSPEAQVILGIFHSKAIEVIEQVVEAFVSVEASSHPTATSEQIVANVTGDLWHYARVKSGVAGFLVDLFSKIDTFNKPVVDLVRAEVAKYEAVAVAA